MSGFEANRLKRRWVLLVLATFLCLGTKVHGTDPEDGVIHLEICDDPTKANIEILKTDEVIITETTGRAGNVDHTLTLQDFKRGIQAVKDLDRDKCFVLPTNGRFEVIESIAEGNEDLLSPGEPDILHMIAVRCPIHPGALNSAVGENIASFCEDLDVHWLVDSADSGKKGSRRTRRGWRFRLKLFGKKIIDASWEKKESQVPAQANRSLNTH